MEEEFGCLYNPISQETVHSLSKYVGNNILTEILNFYEIKINCIP